MALTARPTRLGLFAPVFTALAFTLTVLGTFLPLFRTDQSMGLELSAETAHTVLSAWRTEFSIAGRAGISAPSAPFGIPLALAGTALLAAGLLGIRQTVTRQRSTTTSGTTLAAAAFLLGAVCTIGMQSARQLFVTSIPPAKTVLLAGMWLLIAAAVCAVVAAVLVHLEVAEDPEVVFSEAPTPPSGVVITVLPPDHG